MTTTPNTREASPPIPAHRGLAEFLPAMSSTPTDGAPTSTPTARRVPPKVWGAIGALAIFALLAIAVPMSYRAGTPRPAAPRPTIVADTSRLVVTRDVSRPVPTAAPDAPAALPAGVDAWPRLAVSVMAYDQPNGAVLGPLETGRPYRAIGRYGEWLLIDAYGSGGVSIRAADAGLTVDAALTDYAPRGVPQAPAAPVVPQVGADVPQAPSENVPPQTALPAIVPDAPAAPVPTINLASYYDPPSSETPLDRAIDAAHAANGDPCAGANPSMLCVKPTAVRLDTAYPTVAP